MTELVNGGQPFLGADLPRLGLSRYAFRRALAEHRIRQLFHGVYVDAAVPDTRDLRLHAIRLVTPPHAVVSDCSASWLLGVDTFRPSDRSDLTPLLLIPHHSTRVRHANVRCREAYLEGSDIVMMGDVQVTSPLRTASDLLRRLWRPYALAAADGLIRAGYVDQLALTSYVNALRGFPGIVQARALAAVVDPGAESAAESWTRLRMLDAGLPRPSTQVGVGRYWIDIGYEEQRIGVEYDGAEFHSEAADRLHDDARRDHLERVRSWRIQVADKARIFGADPTLEQTVAGWLGLRSVKPRSW